MRSAWATWSLLAIFGLAMNPAAGQAPGSGKIYCWKTKAGKTECGDRIPYEYQDSGIRELNQRGVVIKQTQPTLSPEQRKAQDAEAERKQAEQQRGEAQRRADKALLDTFSSEREIDVRRGREAQVIEASIETLVNTLKAATLRQTDSRLRLAEYTRRNSTVTPPPALQDDVSRSDSEKAEIENQLAQKRKELAALNQKYDELKKRYAELRGGASSARPAAPGSVTAR